MRFFPAMLALLIAPVALAEELPAAPGQHYVRVSAGTGFFINHDGDVITNAHVVHDCQSITVHTAHGDQKAEIKARDTAHDLAILRISSSEVSDVAPLRLNVSELHVGDPVVLMGYPGQLGVAYHSAYRKTTVVGLSGPTGEPNWLQLGDVAEHGNSGGPVLDTSGNVIAVLTGKAKTYRIDASNSSNPSDPKLIGETDVAITLSSLQDFLHNNNSSYYASASRQQGLDDAQLEDKARSFIVPVRCVLGAVS